MRYQIITGGMLALASLAAGLAAVPVAAKRPAFAPVGSPCFCAQACQTRGVTYSAWTDPAGARISLSACPAPDTAAIAANGQICNCNNPLDWYRLWHELNPVQEPVSPNH